MAQLKDADGSLQKTRPHGGSRVELIHAFTKDADGGRYRMSLKTGLITTIAAMTITAGHLFGFRNPSTTKTFLLDYLKLRVAMVTDFTTLQQMQIAARKAVAFTVLHTTGGGLVTLTGESPKSRTSQAASVALARLATTAEITTQTCTDISTKQPFCMASGSQPSDGATVGNIAFESEFIAAQQGGPQVLIQDEGIIVTNETLMGAAGTAIVSIDMAWREVLNADAANF